MNQREKSDEVFFCNRRTKSKNADQNVEPVQNSTAFERKIFRK